MNRRNFLKVLGAAGAVVALPTAVLVAEDAAAPKNYVEIGRIKEVIVHRIDLQGQPWMIHWSGQIKNTLYEYAELQDKQPNDQRLKTARERAMLAFRRAEKKYG